MADVDVKMDDSISDWEDMSVDMVQWNVLLKQLEDLVTLSRLISYRPSQSRSLNDELLQCRSDEPADSLDFTLTTILQKGRGFSYFFSVVMTFLSRKLDRSFQPMLLNLH